MSDNTPLADLFQANTRTTYYVTRADLPLSCPTNEMALWNSHPRVYLPIEAEGTVECPYCSAHFVLRDEAVDPAVNAG
jgi:uncharacterized Zn-finger protein